jgi:hypothetical protein
VGRHRASAIAVVEETLDYTPMSWRSRKGTRVAQDADTHGVEGLTYVDRAEADAAGCRVLLEPFEHD